MAHEFYKPQKLMNILEQKKIYGNPEIIAWNNFSSWIKSLKAISFLTHFTQRFKQYNKKIDNKLSEPAKVVAEHLKNTHDVIIELIQKEKLKQELQDLFSASQVNQNSKLVTLNPILDNNIIKVGGRLKKIIDCFGPVTIKQYKRTRTSNNNQIKIYGVLFTCLTTRAVHLELSIDMKTDSFLMTLQRFIAWRGEPDIIWCDNGSNFVGIKKELKQGLQNVNHDFIGKQLALLNIEWKFIPQIRPWMGGA